MADNRTLSAYQKWIAGKTIKHVNATTFYFTDGSRLEQHCRCVHTEERDDVELLILAYDENDKRVPFEEAL